MNSTATTGLRPSSAIAAAHPQTHAQTHDIAVLIGRFSPFHHGHAALVQRALQLARYVVILIGSARRPRNIRNPWTAEERAVMIRHCFPTEQERLRCVPLHDQLYNDQQWAQDVQQAVAQAAKHWQLNAARVVLVGHHKDQSSYYLDMFPQWQLQEQTNVQGLSATDCRDHLFAQPGDAGRQMLLEAAVPEPVFALLKSFQSAPAFAQLVREYAFIKQYQAAWAQAPYPPIFVTVDAVLVHSGHLLLVRRRAEPGKGLWALPGGFVQPEEPLLEAALRELREETRVKIPLAVLRGSVKAQRVFDHPQRSLRGRTITHAYLFEFPMGELPPVRGSDDADKARWVPLAELRDMSEQLFEDHSDIIHYFLGQI